MSFKERFAVWWKKLKEKYHLSVVNKDSFVEVYSFQFSKAGFYGVILGFVFLSRNASKEKQTAKE